MMKFVDHSCQYPEKTNSEKKLWQADKLAGPKKQTNKQKKQKKTPQKTKNWIQMNFP